MGQAMLLEFRAEELMASPPPAHRPVLLAEVLDGLRPRPGGVFVDATLGAGGHTEALLEATAPDGRVIGIDRDPLALGLAKLRLARFGERFVPVYGNHADVVRLAQRSGAFTIDGLVADLGVSSMQLDSPERGFSFRSDGPLDMRMDPAQPMTAAELVNTLAEDELRRLLRTFGEERRAPAVARAIVAAREKAPIETTGRLAAVVEGALGPAARRYRIHPATRTFQALRIVVNGELDGLERFVGDAFSLVRPGGRAAFIAFHSLEDRAIKQGLRALAERCVCPPGLPVCGCGKHDLVRVLTRKAVRPDPAEVADNPRARSARLRVAERL